MPWTFAHPAAVLLLRGRRAGLLVFSGLVAGSIAPDVGYYIDRLDLAAAAHTPFGVLTACVPVGLILVAALRVMHEPLALLMPQPHRGALLSLPHAPTLTSLAAIVSVSLSVVLGALTHVAWDSFTHRSGYVVVHAQFLRQPVFHAIGEEFHVFNILQHASTLLGAAVIVIAYRRWLRVAATVSAVSTSRDEAWRYALVASLALVSLTAASFLAYRGLGATADEGRVFKLVFRTVIDATALFAVLLSAAAILVARVMRE